jgi:RNA polymerase sigma-70 factor (ECF subfamily)
MTEPMNDQECPDMTALVDEHGRMVYGVAYRILGKREDAEDVYQDVFLKVVRLRRWPWSQDAVRDWGAFLRVMATRRAIDMARRNRSRGRVAGVDWIEEVEGPPDRNPRQSAMLEERASLMRQAVADLPKRESLVFSLRHFDDLSYAEIAEHLGTSVSAVGVLLYRARGHLRAALAPVLSGDRTLAGVALQPRVSTTEG